MATPGFLVPSVRHHTGQLREEAEINFCFPAFNTLFGGLWRPPHPYWVDLAWPSLLAQAPLGPPCARRGQDLRLSGPLGSLPPTAHSVHTTDTFVPCPATVLCSESQKKLHGTLLTAAEACLLPAMLTKHPHSLSLLCA